MTGSFRQRFNKSEFEFKIDKITLLENIKQSLTRQLVLDMEARQVDAQLLGFLSENVRKHPGRAGIRFNIVESRMNAKVSLFSRESGFEMNDEMAKFLQEKPELEVQVELT